MNKETLLSLNRFCYESLYDFHIYYPMIEPWTIPSRLIPWKKNEIDEFILNGTFRPELEQLIDETIKELGGNVFFKMHRSPKDAFSGKTKKFSAYR